MQRRIFMVHSGVMIGRSQLLAGLRKALSRSRVVVLTGPRQCGKTTIARQLLSETSIGYFDLEDPVDLERLSEPMTALGPRKGLVVIDEVQRRPDLFPVLRVLADRREAAGRFLILGSASGELLQQSSESLAGRTERVTMGGFSLAELGVRDEQRLWLRGGLPLSYLPRTEARSREWRKSFIQALLERDFPQWGVRTPAIALLRFWTMLAHYHGQTWNAAEPARALGVSESTTRRHLDLLSDALVVRQLPPFHANVGKRQVKAPKIYIRDTGLLHQLLGIGTQKELLSLSLNTPSVPRGERISVTANSLLETPRKPHRGLGVFGVRPGGLSRQQMPRSENRSIACSSVHPEFRCTLTLRGSAKASRLRLS